VAVLIVLNKASPVIKKWTELLNYRHIVAANQTAIVILFSNDDHHAVGTLSDSRNWSDVAAVTGDSNRGSLPCSLAMNRARESRVK
jgi:hypothetical protein